MAATTIRRTRRPVWTFGASDAFTLIGTGACGFFMQAKDTLEVPATGRIDKRESFSATSSSLRFAGGL